MRSSVHFSLLLLLSIATAIDHHLQQQPPPPQIQRATATTQDLLRWRRQLAQVRAMRSRDVHELSKLIRVRKTRGDAEPSFSRLFTHATWREWASTPPIWRWWKILLTWHRSTVFHAVWPVALLVGFWALFVGLVDQHFPALITRVFGALRPVSALPAELQGTAIGLLIVFRTNNGYERLAEARAALGRALSLSREMAQSVACTWPLTPIYEEPQYDTYVGDGQHKYKVCERFCLRWRGALTHAMLTCCVQCCRSICRRAHLAPPPPLRVISSRDIASPARLVVTSRTYSESFPVRSADYPRSPRSMRRDTSSPSLGA